jgi:capsular polysaccharide biosynthesis protein
VLGVGAALGYSWRQHSVYQSSATAQVGPAPGLSPQQDLDVLSLLSYGSVSNSIVAIAQSRSTLGQAADRLAGISPSQLEGYRVVATQLPRSNVLNLSVAGPDAQSVIRLANSLSTSVSDAISTSFPTVALSPLDRASTSTRTHPKTQQNLVYGGLAGLIVGFVIAAATVYRPARGAEGGGEAIERLPAPEPARLR